MKKLFSMLSILLIVFMFGAGCHKHGSTATNGNTPETGTTGGTMGNSNGNTDMGNMNMNGNGNMH